MNPAAAKRLRLLASFLSVLVVVALAAVGWFYSRLRASLPQLEGAAAVTGLGAAVTIERDALGVPTIRGQNRTDVARALGWLHAQDRFFQMDLLRRSGAGELAALFGSRALPRDRAVRMHGFRKLAGEVVRQLPANERTLLDAYAAGVNAGLAALGARPFEYIVLRETPQPWRPEDTVLVAYAMTLDLQDATAAHEKADMVVRDQFGADALAFFDPLVAPDDAALDGSTAPLPPIPPPRAIDLRKRQAGTTARGEYPGLESLLGVRDVGAVMGSNAFALAGTHTATGAALLANDMHLDHAVPNIWYRASLEWGASTVSANSGSKPTSDLPGASTPGHRVTGVTLPGAPLVVVGSNGHVAWGFTDAYVDISDLVVVEMAPGLESWYNVPDRPDSVKIEPRTEIIEVKGSRPVTVEYPWTIWGPIIGKNERGRPLALRWVAHDPTATNFGLLAMEDATDVASAVAIAHHAGMPAQNIVIADTAGGIAWTIAGRLPKRVGYDGRLPASWAFGDRRWEGLLPPDDVPTIMRPAEGRIWSGNQRSVGGDGLTKLGDGGYARPARAAQIRDDLIPLEKAVPRDLLTVQLDDRALFLAPWHKLLLDTLGPAAVQQKKSRAALRARAEKWEGHASVDAVSYPIVRQFRTAVTNRVFTAIFQPCLEASPDFKWRDLHLEPALWALIHEKPAHLLDPQFATWDDLLLAAVDDVTAYFEKQPGGLQQATWGLHNTARIRHPFSYSLPGWLTGWLNMPADQLPGDSDMPRAQLPAHGPSERMVVSPGRENEGIFHMPGGQSAHPLSPFFRASHETWVRGEPTAFLPGRTEHTLELKP